MKKKTRKTIRQKKMNSSPRIKQVLSLQRPEPIETTLRFSPTAWAKLLYFRDKSDNEIGGFGITDPEDLLLIREFVTVKQQVSPVSVSFIDEAVADLFDRQVDLGRRPEQFARIWLHTHPEMSAVPSGVDEATFQRVFGSCQWAVMAIVSKTGDTFARLQFNIGPTAHIPIPLDIDYRTGFDASQHEKWDQEYSANIDIADPNAGQDIMTPFGFDGIQGEFDEYSMIERFEDMTHQGRRCFLNEITQRPELWEDPESEVPQW